jgi:hypothetical protein
MVSGLQGKARPLPDGEECTPGNTKNEELPLCPGEKVPESRRVGVPESGIGDVSLEYPRQIPNCFVSTHFMLRSDQKSSASLFST